MCSENFFGARVGIVIRTVRIDGAIFGATSLLRLPVTATGADLAEASQAATIARHAARA